MIAQGRPGMNDRTGFAPAGLDGLVRQKSIRLLLVDDDLLFRAALNAQLSGEGFLIVGETSNGEQAVELAVQLRPDAVCLDVDLPGIDGFEVARRIQAGRPVPIVMITALDDLDMVERAGDSGVGAYVVKPPSRGELVRAIVIALARFAGWRELRRRSIELRASLVEGQRLTGLLPICSGCKKIRDDQGDWLEFDDYLRSHFQVEFTHGICPDCRKRNYPGLEAMAK
jgi:DNA-binding response OmpR family regulator